MAAFTILGHQRTRGQGRIACFDALLAHVPLRPLQAVQVLQAFKEATLYQSIEAELGVAVPNEAMPAQASIFFFQQTVARVFRNYERLRIQ